MRAYRHRCAICALRERSLVQAAHIVPDVEAAGYRSGRQRNWRFAPFTTLRSTATSSGSIPRALTISPADSCVRSTARCCRTGLQGFHGEAIARPRRPQDHPDPERLEQRFERFLAVAG